MQWMNIPFGLSSSKDDAEMLFVLGRNYAKGTISDDLASCVERLWTDSGVSHAYRNAHKYQLNDSAKYFLDNTQRIFSPTYVPTENDVLRSRVKTTGIVEIQFSFKNMQFKMLDVGGQRSERRKWIHCFEDVTTIIFCTALSAYDLVLAEDEEVNRMHESLTLFDSVINHRCFKDTSIILFLNKKDLLKEKVANAPLNLCFPEYTGNNNYTEVASYIEQKFRAKDTRRRSIYAHQTCATDTNNVQHVFDDVADVVLRKQLEEISLL